MKVLVLGATGFIGPSVLRALAALGHEGLGVSRRGPAAADRNDPPAIARLADGADAVVDLLAMTVETTAPLLDALAGRVGRFVMASSGDVYRRYDVLHRRAAPRDDQGPLGEAAPLRTRLYPYRGDAPRVADDPAAWMDAYDKIPIERALAAQSELAGVIVRLPMVYGPGDRQRRFGWAIRPMAARATRLEVDEGWAAWRTTYGYVDDVGHALALAATQPAAAGRTYNAGEPAPTDHAAWATRIGVAMGWTGVLARRPREAQAGPMQAALDGMDLAVPIVIDTGRIRAELGFAELTPADIALERTIADEIARA